MRITFFGDSICVGQGVSLYNGWVNLVARFIEEYGQSIGKNFLVTNASVNGRTTRQALEDMPYSIQSSGVDILIVQFGLNDCNYWASDNGLPRVSLGAYIENIREIIRRGQRSGARRILLNNNHPTSRSTDKMPGTQITYEESNIEYSNAIAEIARDLDPSVKFQNIHQYFCNLIAEHNCEINRYLLNDGLHLNANGHAVYYDYLAPIILSAIQDIY